MISRIKEAGSGAVVCCLAMGCLIPAAAMGQTIKMDGTPTCFRALLEISEKYAKVETGVTFHIRYHGAFAAVEQVGKGDIDIGFIEYPLRKYVDKAWAKAFPGDKKPAAEYTFAQTALGVVVNLGNTATRLTHQQLRDICSGKAASWAAVGGSGSGKQIQVITSKALSGNMASDLILNYRNWPRETKRLTADANVIASVMSDRDAIGFVALTPELPEGVRLVAIAKDAESKAVPPTVDNVVLERYPLVRQYKLILTEHSSPAAHQFAQFACSQLASKTVQKWGLFPVSIRHKAEADQRLADMRAGRGIRISAIGDKVTGGALDGLAVEYVRAKKVVQVPCIAASGDVAAVGAFIGDAGERELLMLGNRPSDRAIQVHGQRWIDLQAEEHLLAGRAAAIVVNPANQLESVTVQRLGAIFGGEVVDWAVVGSTGLTASGGAAVRIQCFGVPSRDAAGRVFEKECLEAGKFRGVQRLADTAAVVRAVSMDRGAIGFVDLAALAEGGQAVKVLGIQIGLGEGARVIQPTPETVGNAMYPLSERLYLYVHPKASETAKDFAKFIATCGGSEATPYADTVKAVMEAYGKNGLIPLADEALRRMAQDAAAAAAAKAREEAAKPKGKG